MRSIESKQSDRHIAYTDDFKEFITNHPDIIADVSKVLPNLSEINDTTKIGDAIVTRVNGSTADVYKIKIGLNTFFVKVDVFDENSYGKWGFEEFHGTMRAKDVLKDISGVKTVEGILGYRDKKRAYFISKWNDALVTTLRYRLRSLERSLFLYPEDADDTKKQMNMLMDRFKVIRNKLIDAGYRDVSDANMSYDAETDTIYVFDLL